VQNPAPAAFDDRPPGERDRDEPRRSHEQDEDRLTFQNESISSKEPHLRGAGLVPRLYIGASQQGR